MAERKITCTPENAEDFRALIRRWPELDALIRATQAQGMFPGLRALRITLTGDESWCANGLASIAPKNAPAAPKTAPAGQE